MPHSSLNGLAPLADLSALCAAILATPAIRELLRRRHSSTVRLATTPVGTTRGEIIAAIYDLLEDTPLAPHTAGIVDAVLTCASGCKCPPCSMH